MNGLQEEYPDAPPPRLLCFLPPDSPLVCSGPQCSSLSARGRMLVPLAAFLSLGLLLLLPGWSHADDQSSASSEDIATSLVFNQVALAHLLEKAAAKDEKMTTSIQNNTDTVVSMLKALQEEMRAGAVADVKEAIVQHDRSLQEAVSAFTEEKDALLAELKEAQESKLQTAISDLETDMAAEFKGVLASQESKLQGAISDLKAGVVAELMEAFATQTRNLKGAVSDDVREILMEQRIQADLHHQQTVTHLNDTVHELQSQIQERERTLNETIERAQQAQNKAQQQAQLIQQYETILQRHNDTLQEQNNTLELQNIEMQQMETDLQNLEIQLQETTLELNSIIEERENILNETLDKMQQVHNKLQQKSLLIQHYERTLEQHNETLLEQNDALQLQSDEIQEKEKNIQNLEAKLQQKIGELTSIIQERESRLNETAKKFQQSQNKIKQQSLFIHLFEVTLQQHNETLHEQNDSLRLKSDEIQEKKKIIQELDTKLQQQEQTIQDLELTRQSQKEVILEQKGFIDSKTARLKEQQGILQQRQQTIRQQEEKIEQLSETVQQMEEKLQQHTDSKLQLEEELLSAQLIIDEQNQKITEQENMLTLKESEIFQLGEIISNMSYQDARKPQDCADLHMQGKKKSGKYTIYPKTENESVEVWCNMNEDGPWTSILVRSDEFLHQNFTRSWEQYKNGFGDPSAEYWLGLEALHSITARAPQVLQVTMEDYQGNVYIGGLKSFFVDDEDSGYRLSMNGSHGAGDSMLSNNGQKFSSVDRDNDAFPFVNCAEYFGGGGWWYAGCSAINPTGPLTSRTRPAMHWVIYEPSPQFVRLSKLVLKIQPYDFNF